MAEPKTAPYQPPEIETDYPDTFTLVEALKPSVPVIVLRPMAIDYRVHEFRTHFPGEIAYAIRANNEPEVLGEIWATGINTFSAMSVFEMNHVSRLLPDARFIFSHVIKPPEAIAEAYKRHRVRVFAVDHPNELKKLQAHAGPDSTALIRLAMPQEAMQNEGERWGCTVDGGAHLVKAAVEAGFKVGIGFHAGSQLMNPKLMEEGFMRIEEVLMRSNFSLDMLSVGGGFPATYEDISPPPLSDYMDYIKKRLKRLNLPRTCRIVAEPGRCLVADSLSMLVRVEQKRGRMLFVNDGLVGGLSILNSDSFVPPVRLIRAFEDTRDDRVAFQISGPASYINDVLPVPFDLPSDAKIGDYIEFSQMGAYNLSFATHYRETAPRKLYTVADEPPYLFQPTDSDLADEQMEAEEEGTHNHDDDIFP